MAEVSERIGLVPTVESRKDASFADIPQFRNLDLSVLPSLLPGLASDPFAVQLITNYAAVFDHPDELRQWVSEEEISVLQRQASQGFPVIEKMRRSFLGLPYDQRSQLLFALDDLGRKSPDATVREIADNLSSTFGGFLDDRPSRSTHVFRSAVVLLLIGSLGALEGAKAIGAYRDTQLTAVGAGERIWLVDESGIPMSIGKGFYSTPAFSPDGQYLAYTSWDDYVSSIVVASRFGQRPVHIGEKAWANGYSNVAWVNSNVLFFQENGYMGPSHMYLIDRDGKGRQDLGYGFGGRVSGDGSMLLYQNGTSLLLMDLETREARQLPYMQIDSVGGWAPDNRHFVFSAETENGFSQVFVGDTEQLDNVRQLTHDNRWAFAPTVSPDGEHIAYIAAGNGTTSLMIMSMQAENAHELFQGVITVSVPIWVGNTQILIQTQRYADPPNQLMIVDATTGAVVRRFGSCKGLTRGSDAFSQAVCATAWPVVSIEAK